MSELDSLHRAALQATQDFVDAAHRNETEWTGWGDSVVPFGAEMTRVKAEQALSALRDAKCDRRAGARS